ncbi:MAG TPA: hypothetical protein VFD82_10530 [Planctomycetota bacterium]|nr:hypothetical protein [Planctomycetota bacterium]
MAAAAAAEPPRVRARSRDHNDMMIGVVIEPRAVTDVDVFLQAR